MIREASSLQYDATQGIAANERGFGFLEEVRDMRAKMASLESRLQKVEIHRQSHLDLRQRTISTWVRDALKKTSEHRREDLRRLNKGTIHGGDIRTDTMVVTERYKTSSTEWRSFSTLYGLTPDDVENLDYSKCCGSLQALNRAASILFDKNSTILPTEEMRKTREDLVALLREGKYEEAEEISSTLCEDESSVAENE
ncbi:hypothetical protein NUU61_008091 [Penicillium alfredii]|uniref:Uncharacterized protein n=1 Tax=Penicillium alfredii TaxID=1506179 RepID=A0A9W9ES10_9EURO|nr:uncharacterized protein NUU61_008091 [Penicillium alfredii]KAJ5086784.1 hypothetical protein NUU61_008091 [Penicillium alfredii]